MPPDLFTGIAQGYGVMLGLDPTSGLYLMTFLIAIFFGIVAGGMTKRPFVGLGAFVGSLFLFALIGLFPLWLLILPVVAVILLGVHASGDK